MRTGTTLTREDETTFRQPATDTGERGLAYHLHQKRLDFRLAEARQIAQNLSDERFRWEKYEQERTEEYLPLDAERLQYGLNGNLHLESRRELGFISENGTERFRGPFYLDMHTRSQVSDSGQLWFYPKDQFNDREGVYISVYLSQARMLWLWEEMRTRPNAEVHVAVEAKVWQHEVDNALAEPDQRQDFYIERTRHSEIVGCTLLVLDRETAPWSEPRTWEEPDDDAPSNAASPDQAVPRIAGSPEEKLLRKLVKGVGWLIGLLCVILITMLAQRG